MGYETQASNGNLKFANFKPSFSNSIYVFINGGITTAEKSKHVICLLYEADRLGILGTVHINVCFRSTF
jgi:hypothetical protein